MEDAVAQVRVRLGEVAVEAQVLEPGQQVGGSEGHLHPRLVGGEASEGHAFETAGFEVLDAVLDLGVATMSGLNHGWVAWGIGEDDLVAPAVVVPQAELGAGMGALAAHDGPGAFWPTGWGDVELGDLRASLAGRAGSIPCADCQSLWRSAMIAASRGR